MTTSEKVIKNKFGLLELSQQLGNVSRACKNKQSPEFTADNVWVNSVLSIKVRFGQGRTSQSINFYPLNQFGVIEKDGSDQTKVKYRTYSNDKHPVSSNYTLTVSKEDKEDEKSIK